MAGNFIILKDQDGRVLLMEEPCLTHLREDGASARNNFLEIYSIMVGISDLVERVQL